MGVSALFIGDQLAVVCHLVLWFQARGSGEGRRPLTLGLSDKSTGVSEGVTV